MSNDTVAVLGLGLFGSSVAKTLAKKNYDVIAIDKNMELVEKVTDCVLQAVQADFTDLEQLRATGVESCNIAVVATGEKLEASILAVMNLKKLGINTVIVKTKNIDYREVLIKVGADRVILPEVEMGVRLASQIVKSDVMDLFQIDEKYHIAELHAFKSWVGRSIMALNLRQTLGINIMAMKPGGSGDYIINIDPNYIVKNDDVFIVLSENKEINSDFEVN